MAQETNQTQVPMLCPTGCGFYGNPRTNGMCSVCYKEFLQKQNNSERISPSGTASNPSSDPALVPSTESSQQGSTSTVVSSTPPAVAAASDGTSPTLPMDTSETKETTMEQKLEGLQAKPGGGSRSWTWYREWRLTPPPPRLSQGWRSVFKTSPLAADDPHGSQDDPEKNKKRNRCFLCKKKVGLTGFECRCGNLYCSVHRYSDMHDCHFDYKADAAEKIRKENPMVVGEKLQKI